MSRQWIIAAAILAGLAVAMGAMGAHFIGSYLELLHAAEGDLAALVAKRTDNWRTAALYQMHHALALIGTWMLYQIRPVASLKWAAIFFLAGILLFSGSLYVLVLTEIRWLGAITPLGGVSFILGWLIVATAMTGDQDKLTSV